MILDKENEYSTSQDITVSAASENSVDSQKVKDRTGAPRPLIGVVDEAFAGGTSLVVSFQSADDEDFLTNLETHWSTDAILPATLALNYKLPFPQMPKKTRRYRRMYYTVVGVMSAGQVTVSVAVDEQTNGYDFIAETDALL
jgi:hypothetical protein